MSVIWIGHEADCYVLASSTQTEQGNAALAGYERTGMRVGNAGGGTLLSSPDWAAVSEFWHGWRAIGNITANEQMWVAYNSAGTAVARILATSSTVGQFQIWSGSAWVNVGATFTLTSGLVKCDLHFKAAVAGVVELYYGNPGSQVKVINTTGDYSAAVNIVRIGHDANTQSPLTFDNDVAHEVVQTTSTLNTTSETKPPTSDGADTDGGVGGWANVDETTYSDADYVALAASGKHQSFKSAARTGTQSIVTGVTISARAWYEGGGPTQMKPYLTIGGTRYYGLTFTLDLVAKGYQYTFLLNPATGVAFTVAEADAATLEYGWETV